MLLLSEITWTRKKRKPILQNWPVLAWNRSAYSTLMLCNQLRYHRWLGQARRQDADTLPNRVWSGLHGDRSSTPQPSTLTWTLWTRTVTSRHKGADYLGVSSLCCCSYLAFSSLIPGLWDSWTQWYHLAGGSVSAHPWNHRCQRKGSHWGSGV